MIQLYDQIGNLVVLKAYPERIISVVPSLTELLFDLGLEDSIVGRTKFCVHPEDQVEALPKVGGTKNLNTDKILQLNPDLIIANKEENVREQVSELLRNQPVYVSDIKTMDDALQAIRHIGVLTNTESKATDIISLITKLWRDLNDNNRKIKVCYLIWNEPMMTVGGDTFIHELLTRSGFENVFSDKGRYPAVSAQEIIEKQPHYIFLSSEPYPFKEKHLKDYNEQFQKHSINTILVNGEMFSWYGSRLIHAASYISELKKKL